MARRRTLNRKRGSRRSSIDSVGSGLLDPDTSVVDEEQTFWWNNLQENTFPRNSLIYNENETAKQLNVSSRIDSSQTSSEWWKNLEHSGSEHRASTNPKRNLSAAIDKVNILQSSTTESENELEKEEGLRKRKVRLKAANRKSSNNAFLNALDNTEVSVPLKLQLKRTKYSDIHTDSDREVSQKRLQKDEEDDSNISSTGNILKSKPSIYRRRKGEGGEDQNPFQDILTEDGVSNSSTTRKSIVQEKDFSKHSMHRNIDASKDNADEQRKSTGTSQVMPLESEGEELKLSTEYSSKLLIPNVENVRNANEIVQSSDESDIKTITYNKRLKLKSRFIQRARKSVGKNAFADALADTSSTSDPNKENDIHESSLMSQSSLSPSKRSVNRSNTKIDITHESSLIRRNSRSSLNATKKQSLDVPVQAKDNIEINSNGSSLDNSEPCRKTSVFLKSKSILESLLRSPAKNAKIFEKYDISAEKSNVSTKDNRVSVERGEITTRISKVHGSLTTDKSPQSKGHMNEADSYDISLTTSSNVKRNISNKSNASSENKSKLSENRDFMNASKSISRKSVVAKTPKKQISSSRKSTREETLKEHTPTNAILPVDRTSTNEIVTCEIINNDDLHDDIDIEQDLSTSKRVSKSSPDKEIRLARNNLRNRSETSKSANIEVHEVIDNLHTDANSDSSMSKRASKSSSDKETRLMRNSLRNRSATPHSTDIEAREVTYNLHNDVNKVYDLRMSKRASKSSPGKETRLTRNSLRNRSVTSNSTDIEVREIIYNLHNDANRERDSSTSKRASKSSPGKETRLTRNSLRNRSETPNSTDIEVREVIYNLHNDANRERDSSTSKRASKSSPGKETRLTRNSLRNRSETPNTTDIEVREVIYNLHNDANRERDSSTSKRASKSSPDKETRSTRNSLRNRSETPKLASKNMELSKRSINSPIADIREVDNVNADSEKNIDNISQVISSTRTSKVSANIGTHKSTILPAELENTDEDADSEMQVIQRNSISTKAGTSNMAVNRQSVQSSNRTSIKEAKETARRQRTLDKSQIYHSTSTKPPSKDTSFSVRLNSSKSVRKIDDFFKVKQASTTVDKQSSDQAQNLKSQIFDAKKMEKIKTELEKIKNREMAAMKIATTDKKESALKAKSVKSIMLKQTTKKKQSIAKPMKVVDKAFLIDGKIYKAPRLPRPKYWATDRLYKFLWNRMEPKYKLATRLKSEKFMQELARIVSVIERRKNYENYKTEMDALMKEMARLKIINTRSDFYHFCQDFLPYEFRVKVVPMLLPGNKRNIPYDPEKLHIPLLDT